MIISKVGTANFRALWNHSTIDQPTLDALKGIGYRGYVSLEIIEKRNIEQNLLIQTAQRLKGFITAA